MDYKYILFSFFIYFCFFYILKKHKNFIIDKNLFVNSFKFRFLEEENSNNINNNDNINNTHIINESKTTEKTNTKIEENILSKIYPENYVGNWNNIKKNISYGKAKLRIEKPKNNIININSIKIKFKILEGNFMDKWAIITSEPKKNLLLFANTIKGNFQSHITFGSELNIIENKICETFINLELINPNEKYYKNIKGNFTSENCNLQFSFNFQIEDLNENFWIITNYTIIAIIINILSIFNTIWTIYCINDSDVFGKSISLITVSENILWNSFGCLCNFVFTMYQNYYYINFGIISFLFFINFSIIDIRLLYTLWNIKFRHLITNPLELRKKLIQFYFYFYLIMFFCFFFAMKFYFNKYYNLFGIFMTWVPQIIYNVKNKNKISPPICYLIIININRLFPLIYFRGFKNNFFDYSTNYKYVFYGSLILIVSTLILYSQTLFGSRWFLNYNKKSNFDFFKTEDEIKEIRNDAQNLECLICLNPILKENESKEENIYVFDNNNKIEIENDDLNPNKNEISLNINEKDLININVYEKEKKIINMNNFDTINNENNNNNIETKKKLCKCKINYSNIYNICFNFHEKSANIFNKPIMITPCNHIFHSDCLEEWFRMKKECPSCRNEITEEMFNM